MHFKLCVGCGVVLTKSDRISESAWQAKRFCGDACRARLKRRSKTTRPLPPPRELGSLLDLGDDGDRVPELTLAEIERRKAEVRERHLRELVAAGGRYEPWDD